MEMEQDFIIFTASFLIILGAFFVHIKLRSRDVFTSRLKKLEKYRNTLEANGPSGSKAYGGVKGEEGGFKGLLAKINNQSGEETQKIKLTFQKAGWRSQNAMMIYATVKTFIIFPMGGAAFVYAHYIQNYSPLIQGAVVLAGCLFGSKAVDWYVNFSVNKRQAAIARGFPDALDLMVICAEAGLSLSLAIQRVARDIAQIHTELGYELTLLSIELNMLASRKQALDNFSSRLDSPMCRNIVSSLVQAEEYGTPISQTMRSLSEEFRYDRLMRAEQRASKIPVLLAGPLVLFIFPSLFIVLLGPAVINVMNTFH